MKNIILRTAAFLWLTVFLCTLPLFAHGNASEGTDSLLDILCAPGYEGRGVGTEGNRLAAALLAGRLKACGLLPLNGCTDFLIPFEQTAAELTETSLTAVMADGSRAELVYGKDFVFNGYSSALNGAYPVTRPGGAPDPSAMLLADTLLEGRALPSGAIAAIVYPADTLHYGSMGMIDKGVFYMPHDSTQAIMMLRPVYERLCEDAVSLEAHYTFTPSVITLHNAAGVLPGKDRSKALILSAHFDGVGDRAGVRLPCALDNASGVAMLDEAMRRMAGTEPAYDVIFAFTNAEESGLTGASDLATRLIYRYDDLININADCVGVSGLPFPADGPVGRHQALYELLETYLLKYGFACIREPYGPGDHIAFEAEGIPAIVIEHQLNSVLDNLHSAGDTVGRIDPDLLSDLAGMLCALIAENPDIHTLTGREDHTAYEDHQTDSAAPDLRYNEAVVLDGTLYAGSERWIQYADALRYHPSLRLPERYRDCTLRACIVSLSTLDANFTEPGQVVALPDRPRDVTYIGANYSDGVIAYSFSFFTGKINDRYHRKPVGGEGFLLSTVESGVEIVRGIGIKRGGSGSAGSFTLYLFDGDAVPDEPYEIEPGVFIYGILTETSKVTAASAPTLLTDPELQNLFEALIRFVCSDGE